MALINSKIDWSIGRNSLYIEPDLEYIETYKKLGAIVNSADKGKCGYTSRNELAVAYTQMLLNKKHNNKITHFKVPIKVSLLPSNG